jgi:hypothetical protein
MPYASICRAADGGVRLDWSVIISVYFLFQMDDIFFKLSRAEVWWAGALAPKGEPRTVILVED